MKTCPHCGAEMEPTPSGMLTCPKGDSKLYPDVKPVKPSPWAIERDEHGLPVRLHWIGVPE